MATVVARWGVEDPFAGAAEDREITGPEALTGDEQLLLVDAALARDHARQLRRLARRRDGLAVVVAGAPGPRRLGDLVLSRRDGAGGAAVEARGGVAPAPRRGVLWVPPAVDPRRANPVGWRRWAAHPTVAVLSAPPDPASLGPLLDPRLEVRLLLAGGLSRARLPAELHGLPRVGVAGPDDLVDRLRRFRVLIDDPRWHASEVDEQQLALRCWGVGTPVISTGDAAARLGLADGPLAAGEVVERARTLIDDDPARERVSVAGRRRVHAHHTGARRLQAVLAALGRPVPAEPRVSVLLATNRPGSLAHAVGSVARQRHPDVELVAILHGEGFDDPAGLERCLGRHPGPVRVVRAPAQRVLGEILNLGLEEATGELVAKMDDDDHYGRDHLGDLVLARGYSGATLVGKRVEHVHLTDRDVTVTREQANVERFGIHVSGPTLLTDRDTLRHYRFLEEPARVDSTLLERLRAGDEPVYGTHALDIVLERRGDGHTWQADVEAMLAGAVAVTDGLDLRRTASEPGAFE